MFITQEQQDALTEIVNIGAGKAAKELSLLLKDTIRMDVPKAIIGKPNLLCSLLNIKSSEDLIGISHQAKGLINNKVIFLFHKEDNHSLTQDIAGGPLAIMGTDMRALQHDAITEIGNIIVSSCINSLSETLGQQIQLTFPYYVEMTLKKLINAPSNDHGFLLVMKTQLNAVFRNVSGALILTLSKSDLDNLLQSITAWLQKLKSSSR